MSLVYDAIIIGSGLGGLSCGAYLSRNNWKVLIIEKHNRPGGYATSFRRGHYLFDSTLHMINGVGNNQNMARFFEFCGVAENIEFLKLKYMMRLIFPEHDIQIPSGDLEGVIKIFEDNFPNEKEGIKKLFKEMTLIYKDVVKFFNVTAPMWQQLPIFPFRYKSLFRSMKKTIQQLLDKYLKDDKLKTLLFANYGFFGLPISKLDMLALAGNFDFWAEGAYYPKGGSQNIPNAFVDLIKNHNGEFLFDTEVTSIIVEKGRAIGVATKNGEQHFGKNIISNASAMETFHNLVGDEKLPVKFLKKMNGMEPSDSFFKVYIGLDSNFKEKFENSDDYEFVVFETYDQDEDYEWMLNCDFEKASFLITLHSNIDDSLAKGDRFVVSISQKQPFRYWKNYESAYTDGLKMEYNKEKDRIASVLLERVEKIIPEFSAHIDVIEIATPLTLRRYTNNFNGATYGWANTVSQFTPMDRMGKIPVKNLDLCSAWTFPGEGQASTVVCGYRLGKKLVKK